MAREGMTRRDWGRGIAFLGFLLLAFTAAMFMMAVIENEYYGLFSTRTHLVFYAAVGLGLVALGLAILRRASNRSRQKAGSP